MLINSERGLQVYFSSQLLRQFEQADVERRLFIEPTVVLAGGNRRCPDIVICNSNRVIGIVELKYKPRTLPDTEKDFQSLALLGLRSQKLLIANKRFRGPEQPRTYSVADDAVLCWAAIHSEKPFEPAREVLADVSDRFLELRAIASETDVKVVINGRDDA